MFTGIITDIGRVSFVSHESERRLRIETAYDAQSIADGASIACSGVCLTVVEKGAGWFGVDASAETCDKTTVGSWVVGRSINLERPLRPVDELGGHIVSGHVDGTIGLVETVPDGESLRLYFDLPQWLAPYVAPKGSIAIDGVSLTVNEVEASRFGVNIIPHTQTATTLGKLDTGDKVNVEIDVLARYVERMRSIG